MSSITVVFKLIVPRTGTTSIYIPKVFTENVLWARYCGRDTVGNKTDIMLAFIELTLEENRKLKDKPIKKCGDFKESQAL